MAMIHIHFGFSFVNATLNRKSFVYLEYKMFMEEVTYYGNLLNTKFGVPENCSSYPASGILADISYIFNFREL